MGDYLDDAYWNDKYANASCYEHGEDPMIYRDGDWVCVECDPGEDDEEIEREED